MTLASLADRRLRAPAEDLEAALLGRVTTHHCFLLRLHLDHLDALDAAIVRMDQQIDATLETLSHSHRTPNQDTRRKPIVC